jgi:light-regulated signal transduction histidine kinase (bacteriophytochrome)
MATATGKTKPQLLQENEQLRARLAEAKETLERHVAERTAALRQATEELTRSNQDLQQFANAAGHDLQEPLRAITGFMKLLEKNYGPQLDAEARQFIGFSVDGAQRMSDLIRDLLAYSRVHRKGKAPEPVDAETCLAAALANLDAGIREADARVTHDRLPTLTVDGSQLTQLLQNLIGNAIKFRSPERPCLVHVGADQEEGQWVLSVRDNGIGIAPRHHDRIFEIFQRLHTREKYPGTGIGLAICKRIVERHGGRIWVQSQPGEGTTFWFSIPRT